MEILRHFEMLFIFKIKNNYKHSRRKFGYEIYKKEYTYKKLCYNKRKMV